MKTKTLKSDALLLLTALIWGFAFVAQRVGMDHVGPFTYNGIRFALGCLVLLPMLFWGRNKKKASSLKPKEYRMVVIAGMAAGIVIFIAASLQQIGLVYTTAGKAGFITSLYVVIVPIMGLIWRQRPDSGTWIGAVLAAIGLYLLSVTESFTMSYGDFIVLIGAFFWAGHVLILGWLSPKIDSFKLSFFQYLACSILSLITASLIEVITLEGILRAATPIFYGGVMSVGIAYTLQVVGQKDAPPAHAAIILCLESAFAALGGWMILNEQLGVRGFTGCVLMLSGMIISQFPIHLVLLKPFSRRLNVKSAG